MVVKISSKNQVTIPKNIAQIFRLRKGDVLEVSKEGNRIIMIPKEVILEDKYPQEDIEGAEDALSRGLHEKGVSFKSGSEMARFFKKRVKK